MIKERKTDTHVYFVGGMFSNWALVPFYLPIVKYAPMQRWTSVEQYMMASKAFKFRDTVAFDAIRDTDDPMTQKKLGRAVQNFDVEEWNYIARDVVYRACMSKFSQNEEYLHHLLDTGDRILVEGAIYDAVWGVKLAWDDPKIADSSNWLGTNWLGQVLMQVRMRISEYGDIYPWNHTSWERVENGRLP